MVDIRDAMKVAREAGLDLVEVAPNVNPPVCRVMDYPKFKYEQEKKEREAKKHQHIVHMKELKVGPTIEQHDYTVKLNHLERFLKRGDNVKITMRFRGRQMQHIDLGRKLLDRMIQESAAFGVVEKSPKLDGRVLSMVFMPQKQ